ncbi:unnamed protein product [Rotaria sp. Silwood2]|nr:unnamed protein product [Rotaria sp. Silwood2]CAF3423835.1 unnamed protein product [Rotaria sp. Silwood2]CAF4416012.1 unnamed protein product [Rotaria sp. Silwood2]CAF4472758.1 unnamed protein product [Rotaria sp. Silwood2]
MNNCFIDSLCTTSISSHCDQRCGRQIHIPSNIPIYDGHIHLNQTLSKIQSDFICAQLNPPIREFYFINNNHKPDEWLIPQSNPFSSHVHIYPTVGIHPKYFNSQSLYKVLDNMRNHLEISHNNTNSKNKIVAVGECGLDETSIAPIEQQIFIFEKQIDFALQFHLPIVLHCRGTHLYSQLFHCLRNRVSNTNLKFHWHCINSNSDLRIIDMFLNQFPNSYIGLNGSITYEKNSENSILFNNWLIDRSPFLPNRLILETDYPYLPPRNLYNLYDPSCAILATALYLQNMIKDPRQSVLSFLISSNSNVKSMYGL